MHAEQFTLKLTASLPMKSCILIGIKPYLTLDIEYLDFVNMLNDLASFKILVDPQTTDKNKLSTLSLTDLCIS